MCSKPLIEIRKLSKYSKNKTVKIKMLGIFNVFGLTSLHKMVRNGPKGDLTEIILKCDEIECVKK